MVSLYKIIQYVPIFDKKLFGFKIEYLSTQLEILYVNIILIMFHDLFFSMHIAKCYPALEFDIRWTTLYSMTVSGWHGP